MAYIGMHGILPLLHVDKGPSGSGEYMCRCPAHDDKKSSLCLREGEKGIVLKCQAGCGFDDICRALGIDPRDLFKEEARGGSRRRSAAKPAAAKPEPKSELKIRDIETRASYEEAYGYIGRVEKIYPYTDADGRLIFEVARIMPKDGSGKTFRQHRPASARGALPLISGVTDEIKGMGLLYRLPEVRRAIEDGRTVYVAEGEKDADTLTAMGCCGTTCAMGANKWRDAHSRWLRGADVVIVPDNDESGRKHAEAVRDALAGIAKSVRTVQLTDAYPELPEKGDISDLAAALGMDRAKEILDSLTAEARRAETDLYSRVCAAFNGLPGYCVDNGCICQRNEDSKKVLGTFVAAPVYELTKDDGAEITKQLLIDGWTAGGKPLERLTVPVTKYKSMDWCMDGWGLTANIMPGNTVRDRLRSVIAAVGTQIAQPMTIYGHSGWRMIDEKWCYLYQGGCIGAEGVTVEMGSGMDAYTLDQIPEGLDAAGAVLKSWYLTEAIPKHISIPLLGVTYLAPLREFLLRAWAPPAFITFLKGRTQTRKSTAAAIFLNHFGQFGEKMLPASFNDTANYVREKAFMAKDMVLLVDDYHPSTSLLEKRRMDGVVQLLTRAFGDLAARGRLTADSSLQTAKPPRSLCLMTGEDTPDVGPSGNARFYTIEVGNDDIMPNDELTDIQRGARDGELRAAMRGYIEWLIPQADKLPKRLGDMFLEYRKRAAKMLNESGAQGRAVEAIAQIMIGLTMFTEYAASIDLIDSDASAEILEGYWPIVAGNSARQHETGVEESPVQMFMRGLSEMLVSKTITMIDISPGSTSHSAEKGMAGYCDQNYYYLMAETAYGAVVHFYREQDRFFPFSRQALFKQLRDEGMIEIGRDGKATKVKRTPDGKTQRLLWIPRWRLDGKTQQPVQGKMEFPEVPESELPEEMR